MLEIVLQLAVLKVGLQLAVLNIALQLAVLKIALQLAVLELYLTADFASIWIKHVTAPLHVMCLHNNQTTASKHAGKCYCHHMAFACCLMMVHRLPNIFEETKEATDCHHCFAFTGQSLVSVPWNFSMHCNQYEALTQCWCWQASCTAKTVSGTATEAWLAIPPGGEAKVGGVFECQRSSAIADDFMPDAALLNGHNCSVTRG